MSCRSDLRRIRWRVRVGELRGDLARSWAALFPDGLGSPVDATIAEECTYGQLGVPGGQGLAGRADLMLLRKSRLAAIALHQPGLISHGHVEGGGHAE